LNNPDPQSADIMTTIIPIMPPSLNAIRFLFSIKLIRKSLFLLLCVVYRAALLQDTLRLIVGLESNYVIIVIGKKGGMSLIL